MTAVVGRVFTRWARRTRAGHVIRCQRGRSITGPVLFETRAAAQAAADELAAAGHEFTVLACDRGRHWHLRATTVATTG